jgi:hypothetical protein
MAEPIPLRPNQTPSGTVANFISAAIEQFQRSRGEAPASALLVLLDSSGDPVICAHDVSPCDMIYAAALLHRDALQFVTVGPLE